MRRLAAATVLVLLGTACSPQWPSGYLGQFSPCIAAYETDNLVKATILGWESPVRRTIELAPQPLWYTPIRIRVLNAHWGSLSGDLTTHYPLPITDEAGLTGLPVSRDGGTISWLFIRQTAEVGSATPFLWTGAGEAGVMDHDGAVHFPKGEFASEAAFLSEMDAARADPSCAFNPDLVLGVSSTAQPDAQFFPNPPTDAGP